MHVLRLGLGDGIAHPQVRPGSCLRRDRVVRPQQGRPDLCRRRQLRHLRARRRDRREGCGGAFQVRLATAVLHQLRQEHHQAPPEGGRDAWRRRHPHPRPALAAVHGPGHVEDGQAFEHQAGEIRGSRPRVPPQRPPALRRSHARAAGSDPDLVPCGSPGLRRPRDYRQGVSDRTPRQQPDERAGVQGRAPHRDRRPARGTGEDDDHGPRSAASGPVGVDVELLPRRIRLDARPPARAPRARELGRTTPRCALRPPRARHRRSRVLREGPQ